jgi:hypothetical protein
MKFWKTKKFVAAVVVIIASVVATKGIALTPEMQSSIVDLACHLVKCVEVIE